MRLLSLLILLQCLFKAQTRDYAEIALKILDHYTKEIFDAAGNNSKCVEQLKIFLADLKSYDLWTLKMLDSWGKIEPGMLAGNLILLGNYDECLNIDVYSNGSRIQGQYCSATVRPTSTAQECAQKRVVTNNNTSGEKAIFDVSSYIYITWDVCIPTACSTNDLGKMWNFTENRYQVPFHLFFEDNRCSSIETKNTYTAIDIIAIITFCGIGILVLLSTTYDVLIFQKSKVKEYNFFMAFSYYTNAKRLYSSSKRMQSTYITCLYGIRTISMMWIIVGHRYLFNIYGTSNNNFYFLEWLQHDGNMFIIGAIACVDTFFVISGFLIVYTIMLAKEIGLPIPVFVFWFHRFLRLTPGLIGMILVYIGISIHLGSGPFWYSTNEAFRQPCIDNWWSSILYIQNYMHPFSPCIAQSWYLSVDTQLYMLSPLLYFPLQRWPKLTIVFVLGLIGASVGTAMYATFYYDISEFTLSVLTTYYEHLYNPTHIRMTPWFVGFLLGYLVIQTKDTKIVINKLSSLLFWVLSISLMLGILYGYVAFIKYTFPTLAVALFIGFSRVIWAMCISWIIFACTNGYGGYIDTFLSLPIFRILSRLTYSMYLTHFLLIFIVRSQAQTHSYINNLLYFHEFWGDYAFTVGLSVIWTLTFESPVTILEAVLIRRKFKKTEEHRATPTSDVLSSG